MLSSKAVTSEERTKVARPRPEEYDGDTDTTEESLPTAAPPHSKKRRKLNDGTAIKCEEKSTGFFALVSNFLSGTWFWSSSMPAAAAAIATTLDDSNVAAKADETNTVEKEPVSVEMKPIDKKIENKEDSSTEADDEASKDDDDEKIERLTEADVIGSKDHAKKDEGDDGDDNEECKEKTSTEGDAEKDEGEDAEEGGTADCKSVAKEPKESSSPKETSAKKT